MARPITVPGSPYLYSRLVVPKDVRAVLGRTEWKEPLRDATHAANLRLHGERLAAWKGQIAAARAALKGDLQALTLRQIDALIGVRYAALLAEHGDDPGNAAGWEVELDQCADCFEPPAEESDEHIFAPPAQVLRDAEEFLRSRGIAAEADTVRQFAERWVDARARLARIMLRRIDGDWTPDAGPAYPSEPSSVSSAPLPMQPLRFADLLAAWATEAAVSPGTRRKWETAFASLAAAIGHDDARRLTVADVRTWKAARLSEGRSAKTVADGVTGLAGVVGWGIRNDLLSGSNPLSGVAPKVPKRGPSVREGYTDAEAAAILQAARKETGWRRWLPWVLAFTGARLKEVADLRRGDVRQDGETWVLAVVPTAARGLKTAEAQRLLPVHPALTSEGFLTYVASLPAGSSLWPDLTPDKAGSRAALTTVRHGDWLRNVVGIRDKRKAPAHSWRHRMEDALRLARVPPEAQDAIMGHSNPRNAGAGYGRGWRGMPTELLAELRKVPSPVDPPAVTRTSAGEAESR